MPDSRVYIAGVGVSHLDSTVSDSGLHTLAVSAGTKALLDAGITYSDVNESIACFLDGDLKIAKQCFGSFGKTGAATCEIDCYSGLFAATQFVRSGHPNCAMMIGLDKGLSQHGRPDTTNGHVAAVALVVVSQGFFTSHAYLRDSAALIRSSQLVSPIYSRTSNIHAEAIATKTAIQTALRQALLTPSDIQIVELRHGSNRNVQQALGELQVTEDGHASPVSHPFVGTTGLAGLCELVWQLRGWTRDRAVPGATNCLQYTMGPDGTAYVTILSRADGRPTPKWEEIEHLRDGRERLAYNPALETKDITDEDWQSVRAREDFVPEDTGALLRLPRKGGDRAALARL